MGDRGVRPEGRRAESAGEKRAWNVLLVVGGVFGCLLLAWQVFDIVADAGRPALRQNDVYSALGSVAMLLIVGVVAARREQLRRQEAAASAMASRAKPPKKRAAATGRRKGRA